MKHLNTTCNLILIIVILFSCSSSEKKEDKLVETTYVGTSKSHPFAQLIEEAHAKTLWMTKEAIKFDLVVEFGGNTIIDGTMTMLTSTGKTRIDLKDSINTVLIFNGEKSFISPANSTFGGARFHLLTWSYFLAAPFKLNDPGSKLEEQGNKNMFGTEVPVARLTFESGTGDTPDDWYIVFKNPDDGTLSALSYIVTFGKSVEQANSDPHAVVYKDYELIDGILLSKTWDFYGWTEENGFSKETIGKVTLSNIQFISTSEADFNVSENSKEESLPGA